MAAIKLQQGHSRLNVVVLIGDTDANAETLSANLLNTVVRHYKADDADFLVSNVNEYLTVKNASGTKKQSKIAYTVTVTDVS